MAQCNRCQAPIQWAKGEKRWIPLNHPDRSPHVCTAPKTCRACEQPVIWKDHEGKRQPFELDGETLHNTVCARRDECSHCGVKLRWTLIEGKWLALDPTSPARLHWATCPKNPEAAKALVVELARLTAENDALREQAAHYARETNYREVELCRLTQVVESKERRRG